jgi:signal transduction histidine kinase
MKTILLVDDDQQVRSMFGLALRRKGYHVIDAESGEAALALARQYLPTLILTDIHMPGGDGSSLLQEIRRDPELRSRQVVLMTGRPDLVTPRKGMEDGADDFLVKPISIKALLSCVEARFSRASINWRVEDEVLAQLRASVPSNLPHECFTPLTGIIGLMEILRGDPGSFTPQELTDIYNDVYQSALRLHRTLRNYLMILELQGGSAGPAATSPPTLSPEQVVEGLQSGVEEALKVNNRRDDLGLRTESCSISIRADDLVRIVEELVDNACKFSRQGTQVQVVMKADGRLTVTDQGRGMTAEEIDHIGAFQQFDRKKYEQQGLGLGLVLVQKLVAHNKAEFFLKSQPGEGTEACVAFRVARTD